MTPACENCGARVSTQYSLVFAPDSGDVACCPRCPDKTRVNGKPTDVVGDRSSARAVREEAMVDGE